MTKEQIAREISRELYRKSILCQASMEVIILRKLTEILHADKGKLTKGTIK